MSKTILENILNGSIVIDSVQTFGSLMKEFPEHPELLKLFAGFLAAKGKTKLAAQNYGKASEIFLGSGLLLHGVVAKMLEWRFDRPCRETLLRFAECHRKHRLHRNDCDPPAAADSGLQKVPKGGARCLETAPDPF
jgi:hypothetical protein